MGFWSWLFGKSNKVVEEPRVEIIRDDQPHISEAKKEYVGMKPKYEKIPRTVEMKEYAKQMVKKAESRDAEPVPHKENVDTDSVEKYVDKIQGRK